MILRRKTKVLVSQLSFILHGRHCFTTDWWPRMANHGVDICSNYDYNFELYVLQNHVQYVDKIACMIRSIIVKA